MTRRRRATVLLPLLLAAGCAWLDRGPDAPAPPERRDPAEAPQPAEAEAPDARAGIPFAHLGTIRNWRPDGDRGLFIQARNRDWYYATFYGPCTALNFAHRIAFVTEPGTSRLDRFSSILVDGQHCHFRTFEPSEGPGG